MSRKSDKDKIELILRAFIGRKVSLAYTVHYILTIYNDSRRFNGNSFFIGAYVGGVIMAIIYYIRTY